jgi:uncharacterized RDD family membrane protein YckC
MKTEAPYLRIDANPSGSPTAFFPWILAAASAAGESHSSRGTGGSPRRNSSVPLGVSICCLLLLSLAPLSQAQEPTNEASVAVESGPVHRDNIVLFHSNAMLGKNETAQTVVVMFANAVIEGTVEDCLVVIGGSARITGKVKSDMVVIMGDADLGPKASVVGDAVVVMGGASVGPGATVGGDMVVIGGSLKADPTAQIKGERVEIAFLKIPGFMEIRQWLTQGLLMARPLPPGSIWMWGIAGVFALLYLLLNLIFPRPVQISVSALENRPVLSFAMGLLTLVLFGPLMLLLTVSVLGILTIPFLVCALVGCLFLGKVAVFRYVGHQIGRQLNLGFLAAPLPALVLGLVLVYLLYTVPVLGFLVWGITTPLGLGALVCATFGLLEPREKRLSPPTLSPGNPIVPGLTIAADASTPPSVNDISTLSRVGFWPRFAATFLDLLLVMFTLALFGTIEARVFFLVWAAYHIVMWTWRATTIGGIILRLKCVRLDGKPITFSVALVRSLTSFLSALPIFIGFFWASWDPERQSWHDKIAGTVIARMPTGTPLILI